MKPVSQKELLFAVFSCSLLLPLFDIFPHLQSVAQKALPLQGFFIFGMPMGSETLHERFNHLRALVLAGYAFYFSKWHADHEDGAVTFLGL